MKRDILIAVSAIALSLTSETLGDVIFNNFGPDDTYILDQGFMIADGVPFSFDIDQGFGFSVEGGDFFLDSIDLAMGLIIGQNIVFIDVYVGFDGLPLAIVESTVVEDQLGIFKNANPPIVAQFSGSTVLHEGVQYIVVASSGPNSWVAWNGNNQGDSGPHVFRQDLGDWELFNTTRGTFRVNGTPVPAPGALALLGIAGLGARYRKRMS